jgi:hypothetical protein
MTIPFLNFPERKKVQCLPELMAAPCPLEFMLFAGGQDEPNPDRWE